MHILISIILLILCNSKPAPNHYNNNNNNNNNNNKKMATGESQSFSFLMQRLGVAVQVGNAISVLGTLGSCDAEV